MDDLKISRVDSTVVENIIQCLEEQYGKVAPLTNTRGKVHEDLMVVLYLSMKGKARLMTPKHIQIILETDPIDMGGLAETPAANHLSQVREDKGNLSTQQ